MEQNTEQNKAERKAKITIEIEGQETEIIETDLFTLIAEQGRHMATMSLCEKANSFRIAELILAIEQNLEAIKRKAPQAEALVALLKAAKIADEAKKNKEQEE